MTRTISLIIGITATALAIGVAPALGEGRLAGSPEPTQVAPDWFERAASNAQNQAAPDWFERAAISAQNDAIVVSRPDSHDVVTQVDNGYLDAAARAQRIDVVVPTAASDAHERSAPPRGEFTPQTEVTGSGIELELPQLGIGFGIGLMLALGLFLVMRYTRGRELAH
jgi:hypothetical protein